MIYHTSGHRGTLIAYTMAFYSMHHGSLITCTLDHLLRRPPDTYCICFLKDIAKHFMQLPLGCLLNARTLDLCMFGHLMYVQWES